MTAKRFKLAYADYDWWAICDKENPTELGISGEDVVELLNELHEENEQLQHDATILIQSNQDYRKENEQLKQQLKELKEDVPLLLAFYRWYPFAVEKKEHQAYNRLWDFVND